MVRGRLVEEHVQRRAELAPPVRVVPAAEASASTRSAPTRWHGAWARLGGPGQVSRALERPVAWVHKARSRPHLELLPQ